MEYTNTRIREIIAEYIHSERDREILCKRYIDGLTIERLSEETELSVSQVKRILWKNSEIIFRKLEKN